MKTVYGRADRLRGSTVPYRSRRKCEDYLALDIRQLRARGCLRTGIGCSWQWSMADEQIGAVRIDVGSRGLTLSYRAGERDVTNRIEFTWTPCRFGGLQTWFVCPDCRGRRAIVYGINDVGRFSCRPCMNLAYGSEAESAPDRLTRKLLKHEAKLGEDGEKPKWMRWRTYERICAGIVDVEDARIVALLARQTANCEELGLSERCTH